MEMMVIFNFFCWIFGLDIYFIVGREKAIYLFMGIN